MPTPEDAETLRAYQRTVDLVAQRMEATWGVGRLPDLVEADMRAKFARQGLRFRAALEDAWSAKMLTRSQIDAVVSATGGMERAWLALDAAARVAGHGPIDPVVWETELEDGTVACIVRTNAEAGAVIREGRQLNVWTLAEVARAIDLLPQMVRAAKETFPGATLKPASDRHSGQFNDPIPF